MNANASAANAVNTFLFEPSPLRSPSMAPTFSVGLMNCVPGAPMLSMLDSGCVSFFARSLWFPCVVVCVLCAPAPLFFTQTSFFTTTGDCFAP